MIRPGYTLVLLLFIFVQKISFGQGDIKFSSIESEDIFVFTRIIDEQTYHFSHKMIDNVHYGSEIIKIENNEAVDISWIYQINDTLYCYHLMDLWQENQKTYVLAYTFSNWGNSISLLEYDIQNDNIFLLDTEEISEYRYIYHYNFKDLMVNDQRQFVVMEHIPNSFKLKGISLFKVNGNQIDVVRHVYDEPVINFLLYDQYYDNELDLYYLLTEKTYNIFDQDFEFIGNQDVVKRRGNTTYSGGEALIVGKNGQNLMTYERLRINNQLILSEREITVSDSFLFNEEFKDFNPDEDCYLVRKLFKDSCNYMYYSRSSNKLHDNNYGFNIITFDKKGNLLNNQVFNTDKPLSVYDIDIDEKEKKVSGVGGYFDDVTQFSFTASLKKQTVNTTETLQDNEFILTSNVSNVYLNINPIFFNKIASIYNMKGQKIKEESLQNEIDISNFATGIYLIQVLKDGYVKNEKFVKI